MGAKDEIIYPSVKQIFTTGYTSSETQNEERYTLT
jgi:hypothetical protein